MRFKLGERHFFRNVALSFITINGINFYYNWALMGGTILKNKTEGKWIIFLSYKELIPFLKGTHSFLKRNDSSLISFCGTYYANLYSQPANIKTKPKYIYS